MTDERLAEYANEWENFRLSEIELELYEALKADRERIAELEAHCKELQQGKDEVYDYYHDLATKAQERLDTVTAWCAKRGEWSELIDILYSP